MALRKQHVRNFFCLLMLSNGTPMFRMGDEFLQTQRGNSNPYNQDNETSWLDWSRLAEHHDIFLFFRQMIAFRKAHSSLSRFGFWRDDVCWFGRDSAVDLSFESRSLAFCLSAAGSSEDVLYVMINGSDMATEFVVQYLIPTGWRTLIDTSRTAPFVCSPSELEPLDSPRKLLAPRSVVVLGARSALSCA
jgi:isoamylase